MRNVYYKTNFNLECPVLDIQEANDYLQEDDMTKYLLDSLRNDKIAPEEIDKVEYIYWTMTSNDTGNIILTANDKLLPATLDKISEWVSGQCSDGLGEGFEQQPFASYENSDGGYYDEEDNWVEDNGYCMASFDWKTNKYKFTQVARPSQKLQENKGVYILKSEEFIKENLNNQEAEETKALVINKLGELGADVDGEDFINETNLTIRGEVVTDGELIRAIRQASKDIKLGVTRVYSDDISPDEPIILYSSALKGMKWAVLSVEVNKDKIGVWVRPYDHYNRQEKKHYVKETEDVLPLAAFTDESVNKLYDLIERYNNRYK